MKELSEIKLFSTDDLKKEYEDCTAMMSEKVEAIMPALSEINILRQFMSHLMLELFSRGIITKKQLEDFSKSGLEESKL